MPLGACVRSAESRAPTSAACSIRAASLTSRCAIAGKTTGSATALTSRMIKITTSSSISVNPRRRDAQTPHGTAQRPPMQLTTDN